MKPQLFDYVRLRGVTAPLPVWEGFIGQVVGVHSRLTIRPLMPRPDFRAGDLCREKWWDFEWPLGHCEVITKEEAEQLLIAYELQT